MYNLNAVQHHNLSWREQGALLLLYLLLIFVLIFSLGNALAYFLIPTDDISLQVRRNPIRVLDSTYNQQIGLQAGDVILRVAEKPVSWWVEAGWRNWPRLLNLSDETTSTLKITILRDKKTQTFQVPRSTHHSPAIRREFFIRFLLSSVYLAVSLMILRVRKWEFNARITVLILVLLALTEQGDILTLLGAEWSLSHLWFFLPLRLLARWIAYGAALHFCLIFPAPKPWLQRFPWLPASIYLLNPLISLFIIANTDGNLLVRHSAVYILSKNIYLTYLALASLFLIQAYFTEKGSLAKIQMRWIAWGASIAILPNVFLADLPDVLIGQRLIPVELSTLCLLALPVSISVAILRYRLWDINQMIRASLIYSLLTVFLGVMYITLTTAFIALLGGSGPSNLSTDGNPFVFFVGALIVVFFFRPTRLRIQHLIDRTFYRNALNYSQILSDLSLAFSTSILFNDLMRLLLETVPKRLNLEGAEIILDTLPDEKAPEYQQLKQGSVVWLYTLNDQPYSFSSPLYDLQMLNMWLCVPLISGDRLLGVYGLGRKKAGDFLNAQEISLLETLGRQAGLALDNAMLHAKETNQARLDRDLEIANQIQTSLLPDADPTHPDLEIVGFSTPEQHVGGDFYHYFDFSKNQAGVAVGDVSGKGIPAALLMAVSVSTLRAQNEKQLQHPATLLRTMNSLLKSQTRLANVNVAMLYATIKHNGHGQMVFTVSNAGLVSPILRRPGQRSEFLDACGLPLGVIDVPEYYECRFDLVQGDLIILCSDGIVEAVNVDEEMFGFDRLLETIDATKPDISAAEFVTHLRRTVAQFVGAAPQHDDITVVVIKIKSPMRLTYQ